MGMTDRVVAFAWAGLGLLVPLAAVSLLVAPALRTPALLAALALVAVLLASTTRGARRLLVQAVEHERQALHDPVTDLPNRLLFHDRTHQAIAHAQRHGGEVAVLLLDLDRFKDVNDTLGHHNGDLLQHLVGARLRRDLRAGDTVARLGGDEFAVLLPASGGPRDAREVAERLREALDERFELEGIGLEVEASTGIALFPHHGADRTRSCSAPTSPCTRPRRPTPAWRPTAPRPAPARATGSPSSPTCAGRSAPGRSWCTSSRRPTWPRAGSPASRRWCAGAIPSAGCSTPKASSRSPSTPG